MKSATFIVLLLIPLSLLAADAASEKNVPQSAKDEIIRRGARVQELGSIQATAEALAVEAMGLPERDDHKFQLTVLTSTDPKWVDGCNQLLNDINTTEQLAALMKKGNPPDSWSVYNVRRIEDSTQEWWYGTLKDKFFPVDKDGKRIIKVNKEGVELPLFPALVIQPPLDGKIGDKNRVVACFQGYTCGPEAYKEAILRACEKWAMAQHNRGGHTQISGRDMPTPFPSGTSKVDQFQPSGPMQYSPRHLEPAPKVLTLKQIKELIPGATPVQRAEIAEYEYTDPADVKTAYLAIREAEFTKRQSQPQKQPEKVPAVIIEHFDSEEFEDEDAKKKTVNSSAPQSDPSLESEPVDLWPYLRWLLDTGIQIAGVILGGLYVYRLYRPLPVVIPSSTSIDVRPTETVATSTAP